MTQKKVTPIVYTNRLADVYPYSEAYELIENVLIVSGDTAYYHTDGNTYIRLFHESLYYGSHMNHRLITPNHIRFNGLKFYDKPARDEEFYVELDDDLNITLQFKGTKCTFIWSVTTQREIETCQNFDMSSDHE